VGLSHDFDYEQNPTEETHLHVGGRVLRERGYPEEIVEAICSHADYMNIPRDTPLKKAIYACDELVGFIGACVKVRPTKQIADLPVESVVKKLKDKAFARSVDRSYVYGGGGARSDGPGRARRLPDRGAQRPSRPRSALDGRVTLRRCLC
jgi:predicted hydrolase (HD superfamily)